MSQTVDIRLPSGKRVDINLHGVRYVRNVRRKIEKAQCLPRDCFKLVSSEGRELRDGNDISKMFGSTIAVVVLNDRLEQTVARAATVRQFDDLREKTTVSFAFQQLMMLPETFGQLVALQRLNLQGNKLATLPQTFGQLLALQRLYLQSNKLATLPETVCQLVALQHLDLQGNKLTTLPERFCQLLALQRLYLQCNQLATLPETFGQFVALQHLSLSQNRLTTLPETVGRLFARCLYTDWGTLQYDDRQIR